MITNETTQQAIHKALFGHVLTQAEAKALLDYAHAQAVRATAAEARVLALEAQVDGLYAQNAMQAAWSDRA